MKIERTIGDGPEFVYAYYFPSQTGGQSWPHKIGRTRTDPVKRIKQAMSSMQEEPVIGTLVRCKNSIYTEAFIHAALLDRRIEAYGHEWFDVHPNAVENVLADGLQEIPLGLQIRLHRTAQGLTQDQLASAAQIRQEAISRIETGGDCMVSTILELARELGLRIVLLEPNE